MDLDIIKLGDDAMKNFGIKKESLNSFLVIVIIFSMIFFSTKFRGNYIIFIISLEVLMIFLFKYFKFINRGLICIIIYITIALLLSLFNSLNLSMTIYFYLTILFFIVNYIVFYGYLNSSSNNLLKLLNKVALFGNCVVVYSLIEAIIKYNPVFYFLFPEPYKTQYSIPTSLFYRINGSVGQPVPFSTFVIFILFINYSLYKIYKKKIYFIFTILSVISLIFTYTRNSYLAVLLGIAIVSIIIFYRNKKVKLNVIIKAILMLIIGSVLIGILLIKNNEFILGIINRFTEIGTDISLTQRVAGIEFVCEYLIKSPMRLFFGYGVGSLLNIRSYYGIEFYISNFYALDNQYFTILFEFGIVGGVIMINYLIKLFKIINKNNSNLSCIFNSLLVALLITQFFYDASYWIITIFIISLIVSIIKYLNSTGVKYVK